MLPFLGQNSRPNVMIVVHVGFVLPVAEQARQEAKSGIKRLKIAT
jgi:hypothetical protein